MATKQDLQGHTGNGPKKTTIGKSHNTVSKSKQAKRSKKKYKSQGSKRRRSRR